MNKTIPYSLFLALCLLIPSNTSIFARANFDPPVAAAATNIFSEPPLIPAHQLRHTAVHDAGDFFTPVSNGIISMFYGPDPETGEDMYYATYPRGSGKGYIYWGAIWVGGIVDDDTLVSSGIDGWYVSYELPPENADLGGVYRVGNFADDEFITVLADTSSEIEYPFGHQPLGLKVEMKSYSWADTLYDDFIILEYLLINIQENDIRDGLIGFYFDNDAYHESASYGGWQDDIVGLLDTLLYDYEPASRILIPYGADNDGDPLDNGEWGDTSVRGVMALMFLASDFSIEQTNFNWWMSNGNPDLDWGPRRLGTPDDPLRYFSSDNLGTPVSDADKYYIMSHPEIDYNLIEAVIHDSSDGWAPPPLGHAIDYADGWDSRFLYSFGPFDLPPGDSVTFSCAVVMAEGLHVNATDWSDTFDPLFPHLFQETLDFSELMTHCRRADSVYRSSYLLPHPGPPVGLEVIDYDDSYVTLLWNGSHREDLAGYYLYVRDTVYSNHWNKVTSLLYDTVATITVFESAHDYYIAVSLKDTLGRESGVSFPISIIPGMPHVPENLTLTLDGIIPEITWLPHADTALQVYMIYRAIWEGPYELYDSTAALIYRDYGAESGVRYQYKISAVNSLNLESEQAGPVTALAMARDQGILFCNLNRYESANPPPYKRDYLDRLYESVASVSTTAIADIEDGEIPFKRMADYSVLIIDESNVPRINTFNEDSLYYYLNCGGKVVFIKPSFGNIGTSMKTHRFIEGSFYHDFLKLDSAVTNAFVIEGSGMAGDLYACEPQQETYPLLAADENKLSEATLPISGYIPLAGFMYPNDEAEPVYSYISINPDTAHHGAVNGIRYLGEDYSFVLFSFPLMAMSEQESFYALHQGLMDLGVDMCCGDANEDGLANIGDAITVIAYLYRDSPEPANAGHADANCSGDIDPADAIAMINFIFKYGHLACCY